MTVQPAHTIRLARTDDIPTIARLLAQLYHAEIPGALRGPSAGQLALLRYTLERGSGALFRRYVALDQGENVVALASLRLGRDRTNFTPPPGTLRHAVNQIGLFNALWLFGTLTRASMTPEAVIGLHGAFLHSVVVDEQARGHGIGSWLLDQAERIAQSEGARTIQLRVVVGNDAAKRLYLRHGYRVIGRTLPLLDWVSFPTELLRKTLTGP